MILLTAQEPMERLFDLDFQLLADSMLMIIAIFVLFLLLSYFLFNPARKMLQDRQNKIRSELDDAQSNMEQAAKLKEEYEAKIRRSTRKRRRSSAMPASARWRMRTISLPKPGRKHPGSWSEPARRLSWRSRRWLTR